MKALRILTIAWMWLAMAGHVLADELTVADISIKPGETTNVSVELNNPSRSYTMLEFTLTLPEGVSIAQADDDYAVALNSGRCSDSFTVNVEEIAANTYKFLIFSGALDQITGSSESETWVITNYKNEVYVEKRWYDPDGNLLDPQPTAPVSVTLSSTNGGQITGSAQQSITAQARGTWTVEDNAERLYTATESPNPVYDHDAANVNGDTKVTIADVTLLIGAAVRQPAIDVLNKKLKVMDLTAFALCEENNLPIYVFDMNQPGNLLKVVQGVAIGTEIVKG